MKESLTRVRNVLFAVLCHARVRAKLILSKRGDFVSEKVDLLPAGAGLIREDHLVAILMGLSRFGRELELSAFHFDQ